MKRKTLLIALVALLAVLALGFFTLGGDEETADLIVTPTRSAFRATVTTTGELQAENSVQIYGPQGARRARIYEMQVQRLVPEGTVVEKGDFVAEIDRSQLSSSMQDAQIELDKAQSQYEQTMLDTSLTLREARDQQVDLRYQMEEAKLRMEQSAYEAPSVQRQAEIDYEKALRTYEQTEDNYRTKERQAAAQIREVGAELAQAQKKFDDLQAIAQEFTIMAPENGMVVYKRSWNGQKLTTGGTINAWDPVVATLPDLSSMESITYVNEVDIQKIEAGQPVEIGLDANPDKELTGVVTQVANIGEQRPNSDAKVFEVVIAINEADTTLRPAMTTSNTIVVAKREDVLHVPLEAIHSGDSLSYVYVHDGGTPSRREVRLGLLNENAAVVEAGLTAEDRIYLSLPADTAGARLVRLPADEQERPATASF